MPRGGRKMKGGAAPTVNIGGQDYEISTKDENGRTEVCVSVLKPEAEAPAETPADGQDEVDVFANLKQCDLDNADCNAADLEAWNKAVEEASENLKKQVFPERTVSTVPKGGKRRRGGKTAKKGGKSAKKGGKTGGTRKRGGRKGGKK